MKYDFYDVFNGFRYKHIQIKIDIKPQKSASKKEALQQYIKVYGKSDK